mgnify:CR=1 FL=1
MEKYLVTYYLTKDVRVQRILEAEDNQSAVQIARRLDNVEFISSENIFHSFSLNDVVLITASKYIGATVSSS